MKKILMTSAALIATGSTAAFAGSLDDAIVEAPVIVAAPVAGTDWTGGYAGLQLGYGDLNVGNEIDRDGDGDVDDDDETFAFGGGLDGDGVIGGVHAGYMYDFGTFVLGGELDYDATNIDIGSVGELDSVTRAKIKLGYDLGQSLVYGVLGAAYADATVGGADVSENGYVLGLGMSYLVSDSWVVGGEVLYHDFGDDFDGLDVSADATTLQLRASYRF